MFLTEGSVGLTVKLFLRIKIAQPLRKNTKLNLGM